MSWAALSATSARRWARSVSNFCRFDRCRLAVPLSFAILSFLLQPARAGELRSERPAAPARPRLRRDFARCDFASALADLPTPRLPDACASARQHRLRVRAFGVSTRLNARCRGSAEHYLKRLARLRLSFHATLTLPAMSRLAVLALVSAAAVMARPLRRDADIAACLSAAGVDTIVPTDPAYASSATPFNERFDSAPLGIAYPNDGAGVAAALLCAAQNSASSIG